MRNPGNIVWFVFVLGILFFTSSCQDEEEGDGWAVCTGCSTDSWVGEYGGLAQYENVNNNTTADGIDVTISVEETGTDYLTVYLVAPNFFSTTISGELISNYSVSFAGSGSSLNATIYSKDGAFKLTGTSKKFHMKVDSVVVDQTISFETQKTIQ